MVDTLKFAVISHREVTTVRRKETRKKKKREIYTHDNFSFIDI